MESGLNTAEYLVTPLSSLHKMPVSPPHPLHPSPNNHSCYSWICLQTLSNALWGEGDRTALSWEPWDDSNKRICNLIRNYSYNHIAKLDYSLYARWHAKYFYKYYSFNSCSKTMMSLIPLSHSADEKIASQLKIHVPSPTTSQLVIVNIRLFPKSFWSQSQSS